MHQADPPSFSVETPAVGKATPRFAFAALLGSNLCLSFGPMLVRTADVGPVAAGFWRVTLAVPFLLILLGFSRERIGRLGPGLWLTLAIAGLFFALDLGAWHLGILQTKLANATLFGNASILLFPIYGFIVARAWPNRSQAGALLLAAFGAALLMGRSYELSRDNLVGDLLCLFAGLLYTGYLIAMIRARDSLTPWSALTLSTIASVLPLLGLAALLGEKILPTDWTPLIMLALVSQVIGQGLLTYAMVHFQPIVIGLVLLVQPVMAATIGWLVYGERLGLLDLIGAVAVAVALVLVRRPEKPAA
jgi:drug/metabolite transporter (DMT)-like permease